MNNYIVDVVGFMEYFVDGFGDTDMDVVVFGGCAGELTDESFQAC